MISTILVAANVSKAPFYIAGSAFAVWAVVLAGIGLTRPSFPYNGRGGRGVMAISLVLAVVAIAMAIHTSTFD